MAEYLDPRDGYTLVTLPDWQAPQPWWIEVLADAEKLVQAEDGIMCFWVNGLQHHIDGWPTGYGKEGLSFKDWSSDWGYEILWQRATQPEELPFIDDEPPAHFVVRPKPRERVYAVLGERINPSGNVNIKLSIDSKEFSEACNGAAKAIGKAVRQFNEAMRLNRLG